MTNPTTTKSRSAKVSEKPADETTEEKVVETETPEVNRIPEVLSSNPILADFAKRFLSILDEIAEYNKNVLAEKDSEWNSTKVLEKARELGRPDDPKAEKNEKIATALTEWESLVTQMNLARRKVIDTTAGELGITLSATSERDPEVEKPLKEKRNLAVEIGKQLSMIASMTTDKTATEVVTNFLASNPLPAIGRDQVRTFGSDGEKTTPKYRVTVVVTNKDGDKLVEESGFTKAALSLAKHYPRGEGIKSEKLREAWEAVGNNADKTVQPVVEFDDNDLHYVITKKS